MFSYIKSVLFGDENQTTNSQFKGPHNRTQFSQDSRYPSSVKGALDEHNRLRKADNQIVFTSEGDNISDQKKQKHRNQSVKNQLYTGQGAILTHTNDLNLSYYKSKMQNNGAQGLKNKNDAIDTIRVSMEQKNLNANFIQKRVNKGDKPPSGKNIINLNGGGANGPIPSGPHNTRNQQISNGSLDQSPLVVPITSTEEISLKEYQEMRQLMNGPESSTVPQSAYVSLLGSGFSQIKERKREKQMMRNLGSTQKLPILEPYLSKVGDQMVASRQAFDDEDDHLQQQQHLNEAEDRKETEQLPLTKDLMAVNLDDAEESKSDHQVHIQQRKSIRKIKINSHNHNDSSDEMNGLDVEFNELERNVAQKSIRRSVVKDKLNWSCQFGQGVLSKNTKTLDGIQKLFMDSRGAAHAINSLKNNKKYYQISDNSVLFDLSMPQKDLKCISINMLSKNLKIIDLQNNKLEMLPEEISDLMYLEILKLDFNQLKSLPKRLRQLTMLETLRICNNQITELPEGIEDLTKLKILMISDNKIKHLTQRIGNLQRLKVLLMHNNQISEIPVEIYKLNKLKEFSLDWMIYLLPKQPKIMRDTQGLKIIDQIKQFCKSHSSQRGTSESNGHLRSYEVVEYKSFSDFILYFHKIEPFDINKISFDQKKRGLTLYLSYNGDSYLLESILNPNSIDQNNSSAYQINQYLDLNMTDKEGMNSFMIAIKKNHSDIIKTLLSLNHTRLNLRQYSPTHGSILHLCIYYHKFALALKLIEEKRLNCNSQNANGSIALHLIFASYQIDEVNAESLSKKLIQETHNINLMDTNGLTPIHVAIKKFSIKALELARDHNNQIMIQAADNASVSHSIGTSSQLFDFNAKGKKDHTPLHYSIYKTNYEGFLFLLRENLADIWAMDAQFQTPRRLALINTPFYKIMFKQERKQIFTVSARYYADKIKMIQRQIAQNIQSSSMVQQQQQQQRNKLTHNRSVDVGLRRFLELSHQMASEDNHIIHLNLCHRVIKQELLKDSGSKITNRSKVFISSQKDNIQIFKKKNSNNDKIAAGGNNQLTQRVTLKKADSQNIRTNNRYGGGNSSNNQYNTKESNSRNHLFEYKQGGQGAKLNQNIPHHQNMVLGHAGGPAQEQNVVNNIFISNLNINLNLNINISIPPSPMSTKGNGESIFSPEESKELLQNTNTNNNNNNNNNQMTNQNQMNFPQDSHRSEAYSGSVNNNIYSNRGLNDCRDAQPSNISVRYEDLSVIDDEMPIQNKINKNLKPDQIQGLIDKIQPEIYRNITQTFTNKGGSNPIAEQVAAMSPTHRAHNNNIFINVCQFSNNNAAKTERNKANTHHNQSEDIELSQYQGRSPRKTNTLKQSFKIISQDGSGVGSQDLANSVIDPTAEAMRRNFSQILQEEPIHICHNQVDQTKFNSSIKNITTSIAAGDKTFMSYLSNSKFASNSQTAQSQHANREVQNNRFFKEYLILTSEKELMAVKYQVLYQFVAKLQNTQDNSIIKDAIEISIRIVNTVSSRNPIVIDLVYMISQYLTQNQDQNNYLEQIQSLFFSQDNKQLNRDLIKPVVNQSILKVEVINALQIKEISLRQQPKQYPQISSKLNQYLQENKKRNPSNQSRSVTPLTNNFNNQNISANQVILKQQHQKQHDESSVLSKEEQKYLQSKIENKRKISNMIHTSIDDANITTERFNGTLKLSQLKILSSQNQQVFSPSLNKDRGILPQSKINNFTSVRNSQQAEQKVGRLQVEKVQSIGKLTSQSMQGGHQFKQNFEKKRMHTQNNTNAKKNLFN